MTTIRPVHKGVAAIVAFFGSMQLVTAQSLTVTVPADGMPAFQGSCPVGGGCSFQLATSARLETHVAESVTASQKVLEEKLVVGLENLSKEVLAAQTVEALKGELVVRIKQIEDRLAALERRTVPGRP